MALDHSKLQLLFNVIAITAVTSLTLIWYLRKRDRENMVIRMAALRQAAAARTQKAPEEHAHAETDPAIALPGTKPDIRNFVTNRATGWMAPSVAQWNQRLTSNAQAATLPVAEHPIAEHKELPRAHGIVLPKRAPSAPVGQHLAGPLQLCRSVTAAKCRRVSC